MATIQKSCTFANMIGTLGDMESGTVYKTTAEANYVKNSSQKKFGSGSQAWQQSASSTELKYVLRNSSGVVNYAFDPTHKYYFSIWMMNRTSQNMKLNVYWPSSSVVLSGKGTTSLSTWTQHSAVFQFPSVAKGSYSMTVSSSNYPGSNAAMNIDGLMLIDLTAACGAGNEPTKEWCDANLAFTTSSVSATITITIEPAAYIGVSGAARKVNKMYIGVDGKARRVKKAYIGVNGVARLIYSAPATTYSGIKSVTVISQNYNGVATPNPNWGAHVYSYGWSDEFGCLVANITFNHASCFAVYDFISQGVFVTIQPVFDGDGKITGFSSIDAWAEPQWEEDSEYDQTSVEVLDGDTAFARGSFDVKLTCTAGCVEATLRITFE